MKNLIFTISLFLAFSLVSQVIGQTTVSGTVADDGGETLIGASVYVDGSDIGTITDIDGKYELTVEEAAPFKLTVSYTGYSTTTKEVTESGLVDFILSNDALGLTEVVITGVANAKSKLSSSVSITTLKPEGIAQSAPRTTAEIFRTIPGIRSEASGGDGNTNITVRGIPISAGGSKYLQLQEDGLPILLFGDIAFATSDIFLRPDANIARIEAIRGGSAATLASNSPGGLINFISKTGAIKGGSIANTFGVDYNSFRTDFDYGSPLGNGVSFHVGGFFRKGEGPRDAGYTANKGGQIKANLTKTFKNGYARVSYKYLNDRTAAYMPMPIQVSGTNADPNWESIDGFSAQHGAPHSVFLQNNFGLDSDGNRRNASVSDGMRALSNAIGAEFSFDFGEGWNIDTRARYATNGGRFVAPFPSTFGTTSDMVAAVEGAVDAAGDLTNAALTYAHNGEPFTGNLAQIIHMFDTELKNFDNISSDTKITKEIGIVTASVGFFTSQQNINMSWLWNSYLMEVKGENAGLIDITRADGTQITEGGQFAYGVPVWGNCCQREYDVTYDVRAPYASIALKATDNLSIDASFRYDFGSVTGSTAGGVQTAVDVNNDGVISPVEESVSVINNAAPAAVDYNYDFASFSMGVNYQFNDKMAAFGRFSRGGSAKADRIVNPGTPLTFVGNPKDMINQAELGWKQKFSKGGLFVTAFYAGTTEEGGFEATTQTVIKNDYSALGLEIEGAAGFGDFDLRGALTYTSAEITSGDNKGNTPRRQPALMYNVIPTYTFMKKHSVGLSLIGQTKAYAQDGNELVMPGYAIVNAFVSVNIVKGLSVGLNANNLFNTIGITESEEGSIIEGQTNYIRARSVTGRSIAATIRFKF